MTRDETVQELSGVVYTRPLDALRAAYDAGAARLAEVEAENERLREALRFVAFIGTDCPPAMGGNGEWFYRGQLHAAIGRAANALAPRTVADRLDSAPDRDRGEGEA